MQHYEVEPPEALRSSIKCFWHASLEFAELPASFEVVPDGYAEIIFHLGGPAGLAYQGEAQPLPSPFMVGLLSQPVHFEVRQRLEVVGIRCFPWAVFDLLGLPAGKDGARVLAHPLARLHAPLARALAAGKVTEALAQLAAYFLAHPPPLASTSLLGKAGAALHAAHGSLPVSQVAAAAHATVRTLERKFKQAAGHTVKDVASLMRFEQVRNHLWQTPGTSLAGLAQELGYADQSHLGQEFKRYSTTTPAAFARQVRQVRRLVDRDFVAFILT